jgi:NitT/TauT family transport system substrate-binding protein
VKGLLRALLKAHRFVEDDPQAAGALVAAFIDTAEAPIQAQVPSWNTQVALNQGLLLALEFEAQWMIDDGITEQRRIPNMLRVIDPSPLQSVAPDAVTLEF